MKTRYIMAVALLLAAGCATPTRFATIEANHYSLQKMSSACVLGTEDGLTSDLMMEAERFCAARNERAEKISSEFQVGIPYLRCATLQLEYRCVTETTKPPA